jgi:matrixin
MKKFGKFLGRIRAKRLLVILMIVMLTTGFRIKINSDGSPSRWYVGRNNPTLWVKVCDETVDFDGYDLPGSDPFYAQGSDLRDIYRSILDDYNNVETSFLRLALYPDDPDNPPEPAEGDSPFTSQDARIRTIEVCSGNIPYYASAQASSENNREACESLGGDAAYSDYCSDDYYYSCDVTFNKSIAEKSMSRFVHTIAHEIGHCVGFMHNHDTHLSLMSYVADPDEILRLQMDDKMGLTYFYPKDEDYNDEEPTFGLTGCE